MALRPGRVDRRAVIGHPVIRTRPLGDAPAVVAKAIERRGERRTTQTADPGSSGRPSHQQPST